MENNNNELMENEVNELETAQEQYPEANYNYDDYEDCDESSESGSVIGTLFKTIVIGGGMYATYKAAPYINKGINKLRDKHQARKDAKIRKYVADHQALRDDIVLDAADAKLKATEETPEDGVPVEEPKKNKK